MPDEGEPTKDSVANECSAQRFNMVIDGVVDVEWCGRAAAPQQIDGDDSMVRGEKRNELLKRHRRRRDTVNENDDWAAALIDRNLEDGNSSSHVEP